MIIVLIMVAHHHVRFEDTRRIDGAGQFHGGEYEFRIVFRIFKCNRHNCIASDPWQSKHGRFQCISRLYILLTRSNRSADPFDHNLLVLLSDLVQLIESLAVGSNAQSVSSEGVSFSCGRKE